MAVLELHTQAGCGLAIGGYPRFRYNAAGGSGLASLGEPDGAGWQAIQFDPLSLRIPPLNWRTTRFLGLPLPPGLQIAVIPERLDGRVQRATGEIRLHFCARFRFTVLAAYQAPDLQVAVELSSETAGGARHQVRGERLNGRGGALLVGIAVVPTTGETWLDRFLGLPDEALALLRCRLVVSPLSDSPDP